MKGYTLKKIWDPVTRLWHWALVLSVTVGWGFGEFMDFSTIQWHFYIGYFIGALLLFRIVWGFIGPEPIRLKQLFHSPSATINYAKNITKRKPSGTPGHNPIGSISVLLILVLLATQVSSGLFNESDDFFESAPLAEYVEDETIDLMTWVHSWNSKFILAVVIAHVLAIVFYKIWKRENLVKPMFTGWKWVKETKKE